jgi:hypothetical protein
MSHLPPPGPGYGGPVIPVPAPPTAAKATTSLVLGVVSLVLCGLFAGIPAIVVGFLARAEIRRSGGRLGGDGLALAGIVTGILGTLWSLVLAALLIFGLAVGGAVIKEYDRTCAQAVNPSPSLRADNDPLFTHEDCL